MSGQHMTAADLLNAGYTKSPPGLKEGADALFQKKVKTDKGTVLYFVNIYLWNSTKYGAANAGRPIVFSCEEQFETRSGKSFTVSMHDVKSPGEAEAFLALVFQSLKCRPYEHWE